MNSSYKTRREALEANSPRFFNGKPCKRGHLSDRYALNGACIQCLKYERTVHDPLDSTRFLRAFNLSLRRRHEDTQLESLRAYLQQCVTVWEDAQ